MDELPQEGKLLARSVVEPSMSLTRPSKGKPESDLINRRLIRIEFPSSQAGIAAALLRAFQVPGVVPACDPSLDELLSRLT